MEATSLSIRERAQLGMRLDGVRIIDIHAHIGPSPFYYSVDASPEGMMRVMERVPIATACITATVSLTNDAHLGNDMVVEAMHQHPGRLEGFAVVNPRDPEAMIPELEWCCAGHGMRGIKIHPAMHDYPLTGPQYQPVFEYAATRNLPVLAHSWDGPLCHAGLFAEVAARFPSVNLIMGHAGAPDFERTISVARQHPNLYIDLCASCAPYGLVERFVDHLGADRVLLGSDFPGWHSALAPLGAVLFARLRDDEKEKILGLNAQRLLAAVNRSPAQTA